MAETLIKTKFEFDVNDAITAIDKYKTSIKNAGNETVTSFNAANSAIKNVKTITEDLDATEKNHHNTLKSETNLIDKLNQMRREDSREKRALNFILNETAESAAIVSIALSQMGVASGETGKKVEQLKNAAVNGLSAFSGLSFALGAIPGGQAVAIIAGIATAIGTLSSETNKYNDEAATDFVNKLKGIIDIDFQAEADKYKSSLDSLTERTNVLNKERALLFKSNWSPTPEEFEKNKKKVETIDKEIASNKELIEEAEIIIPKMQEQADKQKRIHDLDAASIKLVGERKKGLIEELELNIKNLEAKKKIETSEKELENIKNKIYDSQEKLKLLNESPEQKSKREMDAKKKLLDAEMELAKKIKDINAETDSLYNTTEKNRLLLTATTVSKKLEIERDAAQKENEINKQKELFNEKDPSVQIAITEKYKAKEEQINSDFNNKITDEKKKTHKEAIDAISKYELSVDDDKNKKIRKDADVLIAQIEKDELMSEQDKMDAILKINESAQKQIQKNNLDTFKKTYSDISKLTKQGASAISDVITSSTKYAREKIENEKQDVLDRYDAEIEAAGDNEEKKKELLAQRDKAEKEYNLKVKQAKTDEWIAERDSKIVMSIIDTASAVVEALPNIPLAIAAGVTGAVQTGIIASQPIPKFHKGGQMFFNAPPSQEMPILIRGQETVRVTTPEQETKMNGGSSTYTFNLILNDANIASVEAFKKIVEEGMRQMGITDVNKYFVNRKNNISFTN